MPTASKAVRGQPNSIRKEKLTSRKTSHTYEVLASLPSDTTATIAERRRRMSSRANKESRSTSLAQRSPSYAAAIASASGASSASSHSPDVGEAPRTKTGRISTAKKGKPVHICDDCGKIYTRNEHLRRHQLNHTSKSFPCDAAKCKKKFHRIDLLQRHKKEDHNIGYDMDLEDALIQKSEDLSPEGDSLTGLNTRHTSVSEYPSNILMETMWDEPSMSPPPQIGLGPYPGETDHMQPFYHHQPHFYETESNLFAVPESTMPDGFALKPYDFHGSRSPVSAASSAHIWSQYNGDSRRPSHNMFSPTSTEASMSPFATPFPGVAPSEFVDNSAVFFETQDKCEETIINKEIAHIIRPENNYGFHPHLANLDPRYLESYWQHFDPLNSVVNRFAFDNNGTSPLLRAIMVTIGAYHFDDQVAQTLALTLRETCSKLLHDRLTLDYTHSRLWDLQSVFLFECFSIYCSRRPHSRFSQRFEDLLVGLHSDRDNGCYSNPLNVLQMNDYGAIDDNQRIQWVHLESKRRLLLACYALEVQQNLFFGSHRPVSDRNLPMPCSTSLWEARSGEQWTYLAQQEIADSRTLSEAMAASYAGEWSITDTFLSNIAVAHAAHSAMTDLTGTSETRLPLMHTAACQFAVDAATLATNTPIFNLLAISGETFVMGQKLASSSQYHEAFVELQNWVTSDSATLALESATRLYNMALQQRRIGFIYEDWALVLAALVFWARAMWPQQVQNQSQATPLPYYGVIELTQRAIATASEQPAGKGIGWESARACVAYTRQRIDGRLGWLMLDACGVLGKLVDGRVVDDISNSSESGA